MMNRSERRRRRYWHVCGFVNNQEFHSIVSKKRMTQEEVEQEVSSMPYGQVMYSGFDTLAEAEAAEQELAKIVDHTIEEAIGLGLNDINEN